MVCPALPCIALHGSANSLLRLHDPLHVHEGVEAPGAPHAGGGRLRLLLAHWMVSESSRREEGRKEGFK
jgi:hypothetical protein